MITTVRARFTAWLLPTALFAIASGIQTPEQRTVAGSLRPVSSPGGGQHQAEASPLDAEVAAVLGGDLASPHADVRRAALEWMARDPRTHDDRLIPAIFHALEDPDSGVRNQALANMGWIFERHPRTPEGQRALAAIERGLAQDSDRAAQLVVVELLRGPDEEVYPDPVKRRASKAPLNDPGIQSLIVTKLAERQSTLRPELLRVVESSPALQALPAVVKAVGEALQDDSLTVRSSAADLLIAMERQGGREVRKQVHPLLLRALQEGDPNVQLRVSRALGLPIPPRKPAPRLVSLTGESVATADIPFDFNYYTAFVQPLFVKKYGNESCVDCHTPEANASGSFRVRPPGPEGRYTLQQSKVNFASLLPVIDRQHPERSKLLLKPLNPLTQEGQIKGLNHDGGAFWADQYDPDFQIVANWLRGAKLETPPEKQLDFAYFVKHIEPIFSTPGPDGFACINCHSTHAILHLESPETREGRFSLEQIENNYQSAHRVVDEAAPTNSFLVRKPTSPREGEPGGLSHAGGIRWPEKKESWQYKALIAWMGMRNLAP